MNRAQRIIVVIGWGLLLATVATAVIIWVVGALYLLRTPKGDEQP